MKAIVLSIATTLLAGAVAARAELPAKPALSPTVGAPISDAAALPAVRAADQKTTGEVTATLSQIVNASLTEGKFGDVVMNLAKEDRTRIGDKPQENAPTLTKAIEQFRQEFRAKYKQEFELRPEHLKDAAINMGPNQDSVIVSLSDLEKTPAVNPSPAGDLPSPIKPAAREGSPKDVPAQTGMSVVAGPTVTLIREGKAGDRGVWKVNIPNEITGKQLTDNLSHAIVKLSDQKAVWPEDANATTRAAATAVLRALNDATLASDQ